MFKIGDAFILKNLNEVSKGSAVHLNWYLSKFGKGPFVITEFPWEGAITFQYNAIPIYISMDFIKPYMVINFIDD